MGFNIAPLSPMFSGAAAELPGLLYDQGQQRQDENLYLKLAQLAQMDRAQREQAQYNEARLKLDQDRQERFQGGVAGGQAYVFDPRTGEYKWSAVPGGAAIAAPRAFQHGVAGDQAYVFNPNTGEYKWSAVPGMTGQATGGRRGGQAGPGQAAWDNYKRAMDVYENEKKLAGTDKDGNLNPGGNPRLNYFRDQAQGAYDQYQRAVAEEQGTPFLPPGTTLSTGAGQMKVLTPNNPVGGPAAVYAQIGQMGMPSVTTAPRDGSLPGTFNPGVWTGQAAPMTTAPAATGGRVLDVATAKMYLMRAGGDKARAQALAAADGY